MIGHINRSRHDGIIELVEIIGNKRDVLWLTVKCQKCVVQACCFSEQEYIRTLNGYKVVDHLGTIDKVCNTCLKHMADYNQYIQDFHVEYQHERLEIELLPRYRRIED
jgi:hypothetical protein